MNEEQNESANDQMAGFQKIWMETVSKTMQAAFTFTPGSPPPEVLRQIRGGIFQALAESWESFMRSPEFLATMKQGMEQAVTFRKKSSIFMGKLRHEMQAPSCEDIDAVMLTVRHMEKRLLDRMEQLASQVNDSNRPRNGKSGAKAQGSKAKRTNPTRITRV